MWLLGAGASTSSGLPSAFHLIWDFKRVLYAAREKISLRALGDVTDPSVRLRIQQYFDRGPGFPPENSAEEYAFYFEETYPGEGDRRRYIQSQVEGASPSFGHYALLALMKADRIRAAWTTNFDRLIEDAAAQVFGTTGKLVVASLSEPELARQAVAEGRWPLLGKLHGDFHSQRLKNIRTELREQDTRMREVLVDSCRHSGLAVVGYSGRDDSVMKALEEVFEVGPAYPFGLFWFHRDDFPVSPRVRRLIERANEIGVEASVIPIETFDELMSDLLLLEPDLPIEIVTMLGEKRTSRVANIAIPKTAGIWPILKFNALPVSQWPSSCRLVRCGIGGTAEVRKAIEDAGVKIVAARRQAGVICFGRDEDARKAFSSFGISEFGLYPIEPRRLRHGNSADLGLLYEAIGRALARDMPLIFMPGRSHKLVVDPDGVDSPALRSLRDAARTLAGTVPNSVAPWSEALRLRLEYRLDRLWLLFEPTIWIKRELPAATEEGGERVAQPRDVAGGEFIRQRLAGRYNQQWCKMIDAWVDTLLRGSQELEVRTFGIADGIDPSFTISSVTAFSRRVKS